MVGCSGGSKFGLDANTVDFIGHALALYRDDAYLQSPGKEMVLKVKVCNASFVCTPRRHLLLVDSPVAASP